MYASGRVVQQRCLQRRGKDLLPGCVLAINTSGQIQNHSFKPPRRMFVVLSPMCLQKRQRNYPAFRKIPSFLLSSSHFPVANVLLNFCVLLCSCGFCFQAFPFRLLYFFVPFPILCWQSKCSTQHAPWKYRPGLVRPESTSAIRGSFWESIVELVIFITWTQLSLNRFMSVQVVSKKWVLYPILVLCVKMVWLPKTAQ